MGDRRPTRSNSTSSRSDSPAASKTNIASGASKTPVTAPDPDRLATQLLSVLSDKRIVDALRGIIIPAMAEMFEPRIAKLEQDMELLRTRVDAMTEAREAAAVAQELEAARQPSQPAQAQNVTLIEFHRELEEKKRRSSNVVVRGLAPLPGISDDELFNRFMENNLTVKYPFKRNKCRRLGKAHPGKTQPLLVTFESVIGAADVLECASQLREKAPGVFINPDMTRAEAQAAYEERARRRERRRKAAEKQNQEVTNAHGIDHGDQDQVITVNRLNADAPPFAGSVPGNPATVPTNNDQPFSH